VTYAGVRITRVRTAAATEKPGTLPKAPPYRLAKFAPIPKTMSEKTKAMPGGHQMTVSCHYFEPCGTWRSPNVARRTRLRMIMLLQAGAVDHTAMFLFSQSFHSLRRWSEWWGG
jgi:hypothetical protein